MLFLLCDPRTFLFFCQPQRRSLPLSRGSHSAQLQIGITVAVNNALDLDYVTLFPRARATVVGGRRRCKRRPDFVAEVQVTFTEVVIISTLSQSQRYYKNEETRLWTRREGKIRRELSGVVRRSSVFVCDRRIFFHSSNRGVPFHFSFS